MWVAVLWLRLELRRRWPGLLVLALLVAVVATTVLAAVAGARRGASAVDRLLAQTLPATAVVSPFQPGFDWAPVRALPEVAALTTYPYYSGFTVDEIPGYPASPPFVPADADGMRDIERPVLLAGRLADPDRADEAVVTPGFAREHGVGSVLTIRLYTPDELQAGLLGSTTSTPGGPAVPVRIVGVVRSPWWSDELTGSGTLVPSAGLFARYPENLLGSGEGAPVNALVRLRGGDADLPAFRAGLARVSGRPDIDVLSRADFVAHQQDVARFESLSLLSVGLVALLASVVLVGQSVARYCAVTAPDLRVLRALGMTGTAAVVIAAAAPTVAAVVGVALGIGGAIGVSGWMPLGTAALYEPAPGIDVDALTLGVGAVLGPLAVFAVAVAAGRRALVRVRGPGPRPSVVTGLASRWGLPVPVTIGLRFALEPGRGPTATPVRPALLSAVTGVLGIVAAATLSAGVADAAEHPQRFGQTFQALVVFGFGGQDIGPPGPALAVLAADPDVVGTDDMRLSAADSAGRSVPTFSYDPGGGVAIVLTAGGQPAGADDVVLAPATATRLDAGVGSTVPLTGDAGSPTLRVSGIGFVPDTLYNDYDNGAWVTPGAYDRIFTGFKQHGALLVLRPDADPAVAIGRLQGLAAAATGNPGLLIFPAEPPQQLAEIQNIRILPVALGGSLVLLALGAVGHALVVGVRRRRHDLAVLRALGMTRRQTRAVVLTHAMVLAVVGLAFGIPLGAALGRVLWRLVAAITPLQFQAPDVSSVLVPAVPATFVVIAALAALPGRRAARMRVAQVLRAE